jgi:hypothetical protein
MGGSAATLALMWFAQWILGSMARRNMNKSSSSNAEKIAALEEHRAKELEKMREARIKREAQQAVLREAAEKLKAEQAATAAAAKAAKLKAAQEAALKRKEAMGKHVHDAIAAAAGEPAGIQAGKKKSQVKMPGKFPATCVVVHWTGRERKETVDVEPTETVGSLKAKVSERFQTPLPVRIHTAYVYVWRISPGGVSGNARAQLEKNVIFGFPLASSQRLVFSGRVLGDDAQSLRSAFVADGAAIHMVVTDIAPAPAPHVASAAQGGVG